MSKIPCPFCQDTYVTERPYMQTFKQGLCPCMVGRIRTLENRSATLLENFEKLQLDYDKLASKMAT